MSRELRTTLLIMLAVLILGAPLIFADAPQTQGNASYLALVFQFKPSATPTPLPTATPLPTPIPVNADGIILRFQQAGLEAENARPMEPSDYGFAPYLCSQDARRFFIPSLGSGNGGRLYVCRNPNDATKLKKYYDDLGQSSAAFFSWTYQNGGVLVQLNGRLSPTKAAGYGHIIVTLPR